jgi:hypothetical protein
MTMPDRKIPQQCSLLKSNRPKSATRLEGMVEEPLRSSGSAVTRIASTRVAMLLVRFNEM